MLHTAGLSGKDPGTAIAALRGHAGLECSGGRAPPAHQPDPLGQFLTEGIKLKKTFGAVSPS